MFLKWSRSASRGSFFTVVIFAQRILLKKHLQHQAGFLSPLSLTLSTSLMCGAAVEGCSPNTKWGWMPGWMPSQSSRGETHGCGELFVCSGWSKGTGTISWHPHPFFSPLPCPSLGTHEGLGSYVCQLRQQGYMCMQTTRFLYVSDTYYLTLFGRLADTEFLYGEEWPWEEEKHRRQRSVLRKVKRFLSVHEAPSSPPHRRYSRQTSENSVFFPADEKGHIRRLQEMHTRGRHSTSSFKKKHEGFDRSNRLHSSRDLGPITETSRSEAQFGDSDTSSETNKPVPEVIISEANEKAADVLGKPDLQTERAASVTEEMLQRSLTEASVTLLDHPFFPPEMTTYFPGSEVHQSLPTVIGEPKHEPHGSNIAGFITDHERNLQRWSLPSFHSRSTVSNADTATPLTDSGTTSQQRTFSNGKNVTSAAAPETFEMEHLWENLDSKETAIVEFSNEKSEKKL